MPDDRQAAPGDYSDANLHRGLPPVTYTTGSNAGAERNFRESDRFSSGPLTITDALQALGKSGQPSLPIVDPTTGRIIATVVKPGAPVQDSAGPRIGGMATPFGVYLTDGSFSGGAGFLGLALTGCIIGALGIVSMLLVNQFCNPNFAGLLHRSGISWASSLAAPLQQDTAQVVSLLLLFIGIRCIPLAGTHAAEHQVVHCVERGLPLTKDFVKQMPRVHPRCGTNLVSGVTIFILVFNLVFCAAYAQSGVVLDSASAAVFVAGIATLNLWKRVGSLIQQYLATRPATDAQIANAIQAAEQLLHKRRTSSPDVASSRLYIFRRLWSYGLIQVGIGMFLLSRVLLLVIGHHWPELKSLLEI